MRSTPIVILIAVLLLAPSAATLAQAAPPTARASSLVSPLGQRMMTAPMGAPDAARSLADAYAAAPLSLANLYATSLARIHDESPAVVERHAPATLALEIARADALAGRPLGAADLAALSVRTASLDPRVERAVATLVAAQTDARLAEGGDPFARATRDDIAFLATHPVVTRDAPTSDHARLFARDAAPTDLEAATDALSRVDLAAIHRAHLALAAGVDDAVALLHGGVPIQASPGTLFQADSPYGRIRVQGNGNDVVPAGDEFFVLVDLGGNDVYQNRAGGSLADVLGLESMPFPPSPLSPGFVPWVDTAYGIAHRAENASILLDLAGNDVYASATSGAQGFGAFGGFGALVDLQGDDQYSAPSLAQGAGWVAGAGFLVDASGADRYVGTQEVQGFGLDGGAGFLADGSGADRYTASIVSQGTGYSANLVGLLLDAEGDDVYDCTGEADFSASILPVNAPRPGTICHGAGFGGTGVQVDLLGNDVYQTFSSFQALTLIGTGIIVDGNGDDRYLAGEWSNGIGVVGAAVIVDGSGNDQYVSTQRLAQPWADIYVGSNGEGYEGVGVLADGAGNDVYTATARKDLWLTQYACSQGCAFELGVGLLMDGGGSDAYSTEVGQGAGIYGVGALVDLGGDDHYALTQGSVRGQGHASEDHVLFGDEGITNCWYGLLVDASGADTYNNPSTTIGSRGNDRYWGDGQFGRGMDGSTGIEGYANAQLLNDVSYELNTHACNQLGL